jgi:hypothetical protein
MSEFDLNELNKQMIFFQNDYNISPQCNINDVNFPSQIKQSISNELNITTQIKRPTRSGEHRDEINAKMSQMNLSMPRSDLNTQPNMNIMVNSRNNSVYSNGNNLQEEGNNLSKKSVLNSSETKLASYYNNNFDTLQNGNNVMHSTTRNNNLLSIQNDNCYNPIEEKKMDYRQSMNNKIDNFIFNNPCESNYVNPILLASRNNSINNNCIHRDSRMVIQDSNKDFYRQEANNRLSQYSPLSRASNIPIDIANLSVNDFYSNQSNQPNISQQLQYNDQKALINSRMSQYAPLAKTVQYQTQNQTNDKNQLHYKQSQSELQLTNNYETMVKTHQQQLQNTYEKPKPWNSLDINSNLSMKQLPVYDQLPVISNNNY